MRPGWGAVWVEMFRRNDQFPQCIPPLILGEGVRGWGPSNPLRFNSKIPPKNRLFKWRKFPNFHSRLTKKLKNFEYRISPPAESSIDAKKNDTSSRTLHTNRRLGWSTASCIWSKYFPNWESQHHQSRLLRDKTPTPHPFTWGTSKALSSPFRNCKNHQFDSNLQCLSIVPGVHVRVCL